MITRSPLKYPKLEESFRNILDTMTGVDGGYKFALFLQFLTNLDNEYLKDDGDYEGSNDKYIERAFDTIILFSRLIDAPVS